MRVPLVVTQPDRPKGRGMELSFSPVKQAARRLGLQVNQPDKIKNNEEFRDNLLLSLPTQSSLWATVASFRSG